MVFRNTKSSNNNNKKDNENEDKQIDIKERITVARKSKYSLTDIRNELGLYLSNYEYTPLTGKREITMKVIVVGDFGVGKTSIIRRYTSGIYSPNYQMTVGADFAIKVGLYYFF